MIFNVFPVAKNVDVMLSTMPFFYCFFFSQVWDERGNPGFLADGRQITSRQDIYQYFHHLEETGELYNISSGEKCFAVNFQHHCKTRKILCALNAGKRFRFRQVLCCKRYLNQNVRDIEDMQFTKVSGLKYCSCFQIMKFWFYITSSQLHIFKHVPNRTLNYMYTKCPSHQTRFVLM